MTQVLYLLLSDSNQNIVISFGPKILILTRKSCVNQNTQLSFTCQQLSPFSRKSWIALNPKFLRIFLKEFIQKTNEWLWNIFCEMEILCSWGKTSNFLDFFSVFQSEYLKNSTSKCLNTMFFSTGLFSNDVNSNLAQLNLSKTVISLCSKFWRFSTIETGAGRRLQCYTSKNNFNFF